MGPGGYGQQMLWVQDGVRGLGPTRAKAIRDFVATLDLYMPQPLPRLSITSTGGVWSSRAYTLTSDWSIQTDRLHLTNIEFVVSSSSSADDTSAYRGEGLTLLLEDVVAERLGQAALLCAMRRGCPVLGLPLMGVTRDDDNGDDVAVWGDDSTSIRYTVDEYGCGWWEATCPDVTPRLLAAEWVRLEAWDGADAAPAAPAPLIADSSEDEDLSEWERMLMAGNPGVGG